VVSPFEIDSSQKPLWTTKGYTALSLFTHLLVIPRRASQKPYSSTLLNEYKLVLSRPKFKINPSRVAEKLQDIRNASQLVEPTFTLSVCSDEADNRILESDAVSAHYVVTGNKRHFPDVWGETKVVRLVFSLGCCLQRVSVIESLRKQHSQSA
jgi:predicted nucleic acid-binding protein